MRQGMLHPHVFDDRTGVLKGISPKVVTKLGIVSTVIMLRLSSVS